ncbi:hypothetical protein [Caenispirillum bisanense]|uniref:1,2-diacylglycerol 3-beta-galactosyltransferase n=1 Tax=Caenispirillum bisanense TaxID=414052 RepID=A0A286GWQ2_9PROT|nr:hypothetical protein [Caenispirillum bisanense]SOD99923.1 1,2-diacylglycerol 3-beta-galactosyltransferase [Caenispirillum bisanense]
MTAAATSTLVTPGGASCPAPATQTHVVVFYTVAGGGHVAAATALKEILEATGAYRVTLVNPYVDLVPHLDLWRRLTGRTSEDIYNQSIIRDGRTGLYCLTYYGGVLLNFRMVHREAQRAIAAYLEEQKPDMVISVLPMSNRIIFDAVNDYRRRSADRAHVRKAVLITDWTEYGRHIWFPKGDDYAAICGTEDSYRRATGYKALAGRVFRTQGLLLKPSFQGGPPADKAAAKAALGLAPDKPVICMLYGAHGGWRMREMAVALTDQPPDAQILFLCGHNRDLAAALAQMQWPFPTRVVGFTRDVPQYLGASDIFVGKPGPGSVSEALSFGLHLLLDRTMALPQETPVLKWVKRTGAGASFRGPKDFRRIVHRLLAQIDRGVDGPKAHSNTASAEIPGIVEAILEPDGGLPLRSSG